MKGKLIILIIVLSVVFISCNKDTVEPIVIKANTEASFKTDVYPIFEKYSCVGCHGTSGAAAGLTLQGTSSSVRTNLITKGSVVQGNSANSKLYNYFNGASHKGKTITPTEVANIKGWIDKGALDN